MSKTEKTSSKLEVKRRIARLVLDHAQMHHWGSGALVWACGKYLASYQNRDSRMGRNGELSLLKALVSAEPSTLFDVGANRGDWTATVRMKAHATSLLHRRPFSQMRRGAPA